jgi:hypothetical protein
MKGNFILSHNLMTLNADTKCDRKNSEWGFLMSGFVASIFGKTPDESTQTPKDIEMGIPQPYASDNQTDEPSVEDMKPIPPGDIGPQRSAELSVTIWKLGRTVCVYSMVYRREKEKDSRYTGDISLL